jgi:hypothetical protein
MICLVALFVFAVLGVFSAKYRQLAREAFRCTFLRLTFKPCDSQLDQRIKSKLTSKLLPRAPGVARFIYRRFDVLSSLFTIAFFASTVYSAYSLYNLVVFGTCSPGEACDITTIAGLCVLTLQNYAAYAIVVAFVLALAYTLIKSNNH